MNNRRGGVKATHTRLLLPNRPRKQHIVPSAYLACFEDGQGKLWVYDKNGDVRPSIAKREATQRDYFEVKVPGFETNFAVEAQLQQVEDAAKSGLDRLRGLHSPRDDERPYISLYVANLFLRSRQVREKLASSASLSKEYFLSDEKLRSDQLGICRETGNIVPLADLRITAERVAATFADPALCHVFALQRTVSSLATRLSQLVWHIVEPREGKVFVTSDAPVVSFKLDNNLVFAGYGWGRENAHIAVPLTPKRLLIASPVGYGWDQQLDDVSTVTMNKLVASFATRHVFASRNQHDLLELISANFGDYAVRCKCILSAAA
jgi:hypothetical protein